MDTTTVFDEKEDQGPLGPPSLQGPPVPGLLLVATGRYKQFLSTVTEDVALRWCTDCPRRIVVIFADVPVLSDLPLFLCSTVEYRLIPIVRRGFPGDTLYRYHYFLRGYDSWKDTTIVMYMDVDMRIQTPVLFQTLFGPETPLLYRSSSLHPSVQTCTSPNWSLFAVVHPGFARNFMQPWGTPETHPYSESYLTSGPRPVPYVCGGVQGGRTECFVEACRDMVGRIDRDLQKHHTPVWHDESVWNRYVCDRSTEVRLFTPSLCYSVKHEYTWNLREWTPYIVTVDKDHVFFRSG